MPKVQWNKIVVVGFLCATTAYFFGMTSQYETTGDELLVNGNFYEGFSAWTRSSRQGIALVSGAVLSSVSPEKVEAISQVISIGTGTRLLRFSGDLKTVGVIPGNQYWKEARLILAEQNPTGSILPGKAHILASLHDSHSWKRYENVFKVGKEVTEVRIIVQLLRATGSMWVRNLSVQQVTERADFRNYRLVAGVLWLLTLSWIVLPWARTARISLKGIAIAIVFVGIVVGTLVPQELKDNIESILQPVFFHSSDIFPVTAVSESTRVTLEVKKYLAFSLPFSAWKLGHFISYAMLAMITVWSLNTYRSILASIIVLILFAVVSEVLQFLVIGRVPRITDISINVVGIAAGLMIVFVWHASRYIYGRVPRKRVI